LFFIGQEATKTFLWRSDRAQDGWNAAIQVVGMPRFPLSTARSDHAFFRRPTRAGRPCDAADPSKTVASTPWRSEARKRAGGERPAFGNPVTFQRQGRESTRVPRYSAAQQISHYRNIRVTEHCVNRHFPVLFAQRFPETQE
jgi:hypothetical protein